MEFVIITGLSGAGKSIALHALEDSSYFCIDNLPPMLIETFFDICNKSTEERMKKIAIVTNIVNDNDLDTFMEVVEKLSVEKKEHKIIFLEASVKVLVNRYKQTRRKHPLTQDEKGFSIDVVNEEKKLLKKVKEVSDYVVDTSSFVPQQLKEKMVGIFCKDEDTTLNITCMSFGFKYGVPTEADLVFDVRCLPNPFYIEDLKYKTGMNKEVRDYVLKWDETQGLIKKMIEYIDYSLPLYEKEGKSYLVIAIGCTGGKHRSVTIARHIYNYLAEKNIRSNIEHKDIRKA